MKLPVWKPLYIGMKLVGFPVEWEKSVGAVVHRTEGDKRLYLILQYPSGHFDFPKGHVECGETELDTLRRETEEETGIRDLEIDDMRESISYFYEAKGNEQARRVREGRGTVIFKQVHFYPARTGEAVVTLSFEHVGFLWLPYEQALERLTFVNARRVLEATEQYLEGKNPRRAL